MADTPGRLLSSLSNGGDKHSPPVGGCVGVFFQLFDWNRRLSGKRFFSTKLLPAERPQVSKKKKFRDEKLPMAKLLLIADENRGGFPKTSGNNCPSDAGTSGNSCHSGNSCYSDAGSERSSENGSNKRTPGVVARLMGLDYLPDAENMDTPNTSGSASRHTTIHPTQCQAERYRHEKKSAPVSLQECIQHEKEAESKLIESQHPPLPQDKPMDVHHDISQAKKEACKRTSVEDKMPKKIGKLVPSHGKHLDALEDPKQYLFSRLQLSPQCKVLPFPSIFSPSKSNKLASPIKCASPASKKTALLLEAAVKILEPNRESSRRALALAEREYRSITTSNKRESAHIKNDSKDKQSNPSTPSSARSHHTTLSSNGPGDDTQLQSETDKKTLLYSKLEGQRRPPLPRQTSLPSLRKKSNSSNSKDKDSKNVKRQLSIPASKTVKESVKSTQSCNKQDGRISISNQPTTIVDHTPDYKPESVENKGYVPHCSQTEGSSDTPTLRRSGSAKEEISFPLPSGPSLFRSKSVKEDTGVQKQTSVQQDTCTNLRVSKDLKSKSEKRLRSGLTDISTEAAKKEKKDFVKSKVAAEVVAPQVLRSSRGKRVEAKQKDISPRLVAPNRCQKGEQPTNSSAENKVANVLSYSRIFGTKKENKNLVKESCQGAESTMKKDMVKSLLNKKGANKEPAQSSLPEIKKKRTGLASTSKISGQYSQKQEEKQLDENVLVPEHQIKNCRAKTDVTLHKPNAGENLEESSAKDTVRDVEVATEQAMSSDEPLTKCQSEPVLKERNQQNSFRWTNVQVPVLKASREMHGSALDKQHDRLHEYEKMQEQVYFEHDISDKSLEDILKTILFKSLRNGGPETIIEDSSETNDMEALNSNQDAESESRNSLPLPCQETFAFQDTGAGENVTPDWANSAGRCRGLLSKVDECEETPTVDDRGQPSPVSVLDFSMIDSSFPNTTPDLVERSANSGTNDCQTSPKKLESVSNDKIMEAILDISRIRCLDLSMVGLSDNASPCPSYEMEYYVRESLILTGHLTDEHLHPDDYAMINPLEDQDEVSTDCDRASFLPLQNQHMPSHLGPNQNVLFDCIQEALDMALHPPSHNNPWVKCQSWKAEPSGEHLVTDVCRQLFIWQESTSLMVDDLVDMDMNTTFGKWIDLSEELTDIGTDIERLIFRSMVEDLLEDILSLQDRNRMACPLLRRPRKNMSVTVL